MRFSSLFLTGCALAAFAYFSYTTGDSTPTRIWGAVFFMMAMLSLFIRYPHRMPSIEEQRNLPPEP